MYVSPATRLASDGVTGSERSMKTYLVMVPESSSAIVLLSLSSKTEATTGSAAPGTIGPPEPTASTILP